MTKKELLAAWAEGRYALGWRGSLATWILDPVIKDILVKENGL